MELYSGKLSPCTSFSENTTMRKHSQVTPVSPGSPLGITLSLIPSNAFTMRNYTAGRKLRWGGSRRKHPASPNSPWKQQPQRAALHSGSPATVINTRQHENRALISVPFLCFSDYITFWYKDRSVCLTHVWFSKEQNRKTRWKTMPIIFSAYFRLSPSPPESSSISCSIFFKYFQYFQYFPHHHTSLFIIPAIWFLKFPSSNQWKLYLPLPEMKFQWTISEEMPGAYLPADWWSLRNCQVMVLTSHKTAYSTH